MFHLSEIQLPTDIHQLNSEHTCAVLSVFKCTRVHVRVGTVCLVTLMQPELLH